MAIVTGLMWFFTAVTFAAAFWFFAKVVPGTLERRTQRQIALHSEAVTALATALSHPQAEGLKARLLANYDAHRAALLALKPDADVPAPRAFEARLAA